MLADFRFALRSLLRTPVFTAVAVVMLAAGIGLSMFMFSAMNTLALQPLPFRNADRLVHVDRIDVNADREESKLSMAEFLVLREHQQSIDTLSAYANVTMNVSGAEGPPERLFGAGITPDVFTTLGIAPVVGRDFSAADGKPGSAGVAIIGHRLWELRFNLASDIVGRHFRVNGRDVEIVGVMPPKFAFPRAESVWMPLSMDRAEADRAGAVSVEAFGPLRDATTIAQASDELSSLLAASDVKSADQTVQRRAHIVRMDQVFVPAQMLRSTTAMSIAVFLVLLISCANVASLVLARFNHRRRDLSIRSALGASRRRLMGQVFSETTVIAVLAALLGYAGARVGGQLMMNSLAKVPGHMPYWLDFEVTFADIVFSVGIAGFVALVAGWLPARRVAAHEPRAELAQGGQANIGAERRAGRVLVAFEVALCTALLASAALAIDSSIKAQHYPIGIATEGMLTGRLGLSSDDYSDADARQRFFDQLQVRLASLPGVSGAALASSLPLMSYERSDYERDGDVPVRNARRERAWTASVGDDYFSVLGIALREGRGFDQRDRADSAPVAIVSASFAANAWPGKGALGQRLRLHSDDAAGAWLDVVGVVDDNLMGSPFWGGENNIFRPLAQDPVSSFSFVVHADQASPALSEAVRSAVASIDADLPIYALQSMEDLRAQTFWPQTTLMRLFGIFAVFATILAISGIHAVLAFDVAGRAAEIGVRRALGADTRSVVDLILRRAGRQVGIGLIVGIPLAVVFSVLLSHNLMPGAAVDPLAYFSALLVLLAAVTLAAVLPLRRALRVDPMVALRHE